MTPDSPSMQLSIANEIGLDGSGLFTGEGCSIKLIPAEENHGIVFKRVDMENAPEIPALSQFVSETPRCTCLSNGGARIGMVEHLLSALSALQIDNVLVEVTGPEIPSVDGSSLPFVEMIERAGLRRQKIARNVLKIQTPVYWSQGDVHIIALPYSGFKISFTAHYPQSPLIQSQYFTYQSLESDYKNQIAPCRTFSVYEEIMPLIERGFLKGGGLHNALVLQGDKVLNPEGLRFTDEVVRHKILDLIGDLALVGRPLEAHVISICSGHFANVAFAKLLGTLVNV